MNILITGSCGYLGSELTMCMVKRGHQVVGIDSLFYNQHNIPLLPYQVYDTPESGDYHFIKADCRDWNSIKDLVNNADVIFPTHALVGAPLCDKKKKLAKETNYDSIKELLKLVGHDQRIVFFDSNSGYGASDKVCTEESPINCLSHYAKLKNDAANLVLEKHQNSLVFRLATVFGPSLRNRYDLMVNDFIYRAYFEKKMMIFNGEYRRNFVHNNDVVIACVWAIENGGKGEIYNLGNDKENKTKIELAKQIQKAIPFQLTIGEGKDIDQRDYEVSSEKLKKAGFIAHRTVNQAIDEFKEYFQYLPEKKKIREKLLKYNRNI